MSVTDIPLIDKQPKIAVENVVSALAKDKPIINWEITPANDSSKLLDQYLMLSKIRLTSELLNDKLNYFFSFGIDFLIERNGFFFYKFSASGYNNDGWLCNGTSCV